eukprot:GFUD01106423.1.p1 GENE.GFUD01106423.1~~GFUD01106423.1.p1  ORF type:complete len:238 (+),score=63.57 GFUD01106423.1:64-714(+)
MVTWDKLSKNPGAVEIYRVFWRPVGAKGSNKTDIVEIKLVLHELASETLYEVVIKAGNADGTSQLAEPVHFQTTAGLSVEQAPLMSNVGEGFGIFLVVLIIIGAIISVIYILHKKNLILFIVKKPDRPWLMRILSILLETHLFMNRKYHYRIQLEKTTMSTSAAPPPGPVNCQEHLLSLPHPRSQEETEVRQSCLMEKFRTGVTEATHGEGFVRMK